MSNIDPEDISDFEEDYSDEDYDFCQNCGRDYDEIDYEYQRCHHCGHDRDEEE